MTRPPLAVRTVAAAEYLFDSRQSDLGCSAVGVVCVVLIPISAPIPAAHLYRPNAEGECA